MIESELLGRLEKTLARLYGEDNLTPATIVCVLTDLRHLCGRNAFSFVALDQAAHERYLADIGRGTTWTAEEILRNEG